MVLQAQRWVVWCHPFYLQADVHNKLTCLTALTLPQLFHNLQGYQ
jgi:hypothetical protein